MEKPASETPAVIVKPSREPEGMRQMDLPPFSQRLRLENGENRGFIPRFSTLNKPGMAYPEF